MKDIQNNKYKRNLEIEEVGIKDITLPLYISDKSKKRQLVIAKVKWSYIFFRSNHNRQSE